VLETISGLVDEVFSIELDDLSSAAALLSELEMLSARDAPHVAGMERHGISRIVSFDGGFDVVPGIERIAD
jgi:hypothetical protein